MTALSTRMAKNRREKYPFASGGVTRIDDIRRLAELKIPACIIGRALYEKTIDLKEALEFEER